MSSPDGEFGSCDEIARLVRTLRLLGIPSIHELGSRAGALVALDLTQAAP
jgi:hypothetical protein